MKKESTAEYFLGRKLIKEAKRSKMGKEPVGDLGWLKHLPLDKEFWRRWKAIDALINQELAKEKKWHSDYDKAMAPLENGIPSLVKRKSYWAEDEAEANNEEPEEEDIYEEKTHEVYESGEIVDEFFDEEMVEEVFAEKLEVIEPIPADDRPAPDNSHLSLMPRMAVPKVNLLMRRYPVDLKQSLARSLFESQRLVSQDPKNLLPALCFYEIGVADEATFVDICADALLGGPYYRNRPFGFAEYRRDHLRLFHLLKREKQRYFLGNRFLRRAAAAKAGREGPKAAEQLLMSLWERFEAAYSSLTQKQWNALKQVRVKRRTQVSVAKGMRISLDSFRDRLEGAELKFRRALSELSSFAPSVTYRKNKLSNYSCSGLLDKRDVKRVAPLFRVDPKTGRKTEIPFYQGEKRERPGVNKTLIKAWAYDSTQVPDFSFTDYFTKLFSAGATQRMQGGDSLHDRSSGVHTHETKTRNREHYHPNHEDRDDDDD